VCTQVVVRGIHECVHFIILLRNTSAHYAMKCAYKNDIKTTHLPKYIFIYITIRFGLGTLQSPPLIYALSSVHHVPIYNKISKIPKKMWVFCLHCILMLPRSILRTVPGPLDLYKPYGLILELFDFTVQNAYQMHLKSTFLIHLNHIQINNMISIMYIFL
jgi:hypothetical protein